jgi:hypothetical protein
MHACVNVYVCTASQPRVPKCGYLWTQPNNMPESTRWISWRIVSRNLAQILLFRKATLTAKECCKVTEIEEYFLGFMSGWRMMMTYAWTQICRLYVCNCMRCVDVITHTLSPFSLA